MKQSNRSIVEGCKIIDQENNDWYGNHKWKIIRQEEGWKHTLFTKIYGVVYHLQCSKCGNVLEQFLRLNCPGCRGEKK